MSKKIAISACLLGLNCRYDGKSKKDEQLLKSFNCKEIYPFCPEVNIFGSPRETIDLFDIDGKIKAIGSESKKDYTILLENEAVKFFELHPDIKIFYFKSKSPSCALSSAKVYNKDYTLLDSKGMGVFAKKIKSLYKEAEFFER